MWTPYKTFVHFIHSSLVKQHKKRWRKNAFPFEGNCRLENTLTAWWNTSHATATTMAALVTSSQSYELCILGSFIVSFFSFVIFRWAGGNGKVTFPSYAIIRMGMQALLLDARCCWPTDAGCPSFGTGRHVQIDRLASCFRGYLHENRLKVITFWREWIVR